MKIKKKKSALLWLTTSFIVPNILYTTPQSTTHTHALDQELESFLENKTPLHLSVQSLKNFISRGPTESIYTKFTKSHDDHMTSKKNIFNATFVKYIKTIYNEPSYAEVLSQNATHIVDFLELTTEMSLGVETTYVALRLFYNKLKAAELIDDSMMLQILPHLNPHLGRFFDEHMQETSLIDLDVIKQHIEKTIDAKLSAHQTTSQPSSNDIVQDIMAMVHQEEQRIQKRASKQAARERLRAVVLRFLDLALNKLMWNIDAPESIWQSFLTITQQLQMLGAENIINHLDDLDDLLWTTTHRFCYFIDLLGGHLPLSFFEEIEYDLTNNLVFFLEAPEQDHEITSKKNTIAQTLIKAKAKAYAYETQGLMS
ncbi:MAG: hypothetical protein US69_C0008G0002 [candidate division TM6 bacterium GW2011_GWF2_38_10]|nr:MAG: hypothetical protein US69_C0008G0002 [candidate division TM6 bacterium GW2011_GWF2_38_10]